jgi:hypothetical protein
LDWRGHQPITELQLDNEIKKTMPKVWRPRQPLFKRIIMHLKTKVGLAGTPTNYRIEYSKNFGYLEDIKAIELSTKFYQS